MSSALRPSRLLACLIALLVLAPFLPYLSPQPARAAAALHYLFGSGSTHGGRPITLRVKLTESAPAGGAQVRLASERPDIIPLPEIVTVPAGQTERAFQVITNPILSDSYIRVSASFGGRTVGREVLIREPRLRALYVQTVIRAGGEGKLTVCLTGAAPSEGIAVRLSGDMPTALLAPATIAIAPGAGCHSIAAPAGDVTEDTPVLISARYQGVSRFRNTIVRDYGDTTKPTPSATVAATSTATPTASPTTTAAMSPTPTSTTDTTAPTATASATSTQVTASTATSTSALPAEAVTIRLTSGSATVVKGGTVSFAVCLATSPDAQTLVSFSSSNLGVVLDEEIAPTQWIFAGGASGSDLCASVLMTGRTSGPEQLGIGEVNLKANLVGVVYLSPVVTFTAPTPTSTETAAPTQTNTTVPTLTPTAVATATVTAIPSATASTTPTATATATSTATHTPVPTATATQTPLPAATATQTPLPTATATHTSIPTATAAATQSATSTPSATATATATASPTATATVPADPVVISLAEGQSATVPKGSTVTLSVCLSPLEPQARYLTYRSNDESVVLTESISPPNDFIAPGACHVVAMPGRTSGSGSSGVGPVQLISNLNGTDYDITEYNGPVITFTVPSP